jgi:hypothetical protein
MKNLTATVCAACAISFGAFAAADGETVLKDPAKQAVKAWFLDNVYGHAPIGRPKDMTFAGNSIVFGGGKMKVDLTVALPASASKAGRFSRALTARGGMA